MSLRFLADQCVPFSIIESLRRHDHEVIPLRDLLPIRAPDIEVIAKADELQLILISLNGDFSDIVAYPPAEHHGIISIQLHNHPELIPPVMRRLAQHMSQHSTQENYVGKLLIVESYRIRIRS